MLKITVITNHKKLHYYYPKPPLHQLIQNNEDAHYSGRIWFVMPMNKAKRTFSFLPVNAMFCKSLNSELYTTTDTNYIKLTLVLLTLRIQWDPNNASKWQMGFNSAFKGLNKQIKEIKSHYYLWVYFSNQLNIKIKLHLKLGMGIKNKEQ